MFLVQVAADAITQRPQAGGCGNVEVSAGLVSSDKVGDNEA